MRAHVGLQVLVRWGLQRGTSTIPKSTKVSHMRANLEAAHWELPPDELKALNVLGYQARAQHSVKHQVRWPV